MRYKNEIRDKVIFLTKIKIIFPKRFLQLLVTYYLNEDAANTDPCRMSKNWIIDRIRQIGYQSLGCKPSLKYNPC